MLEKDAGVFFMNADGIFDGLRSAGTIYKIAIQVMNSALAVAA